MEVTPAVVMPRGEGSPPPSTASILSSQATEPTDGEDCGARRL